MVDVQTKFSDELSSRSMYRKLFEKQVEFVPSLDGDRRLKPSRRALPVIRDKESLSGKNHGLLTEKQRLWANAATNDSKTENPVYRRHEKQSTFNQIKMTDDELRSLEVRGLPDQIPAISTESNVLERIQLSRKQRHETAVDDMHQELSILGNDFEAQIEENCQMVRDNLRANDQDIECLFKKISEDEMLVRYSMPQLSDLWTTVTMQASARRQWITELDATLERLEQDRSIMISEILKSYTERLQSIAYISPADINKLIANEILSINLSVLSNRRSYAELYSKLMTADCERERRQLNLWLNRVTDWRVLNCELSQYMFVQYMNSSKIVNPPEVRRLMTLLTVEQAQLNKRRLELIDKMSVMKPPSATKTFVYDWHSSLQRVQKEFGSLHGRYMTLFAEAQTAVNAECIDEMERCRVALLESDVCTEQTVYDIINQCFLPMIEQREKQATAMLNDVKRSLDSVMSFQDSQLQSLFQFAQGAAHLWDEHQLASTEQENGLKTELGKSRQAHDSNNQLLEAELDLIMDRMRQDKTEESLAGNLKQALTMLDRIREGYSSFHNEVISKVDVYPTAVQSVVVAYDTAVLKYFSVDRKPLAKPKKKGPRVKNKGDGRQTSIGGRQSVGSLDASVMEILSTAGGVTFYVLSDPGEHGLGVNNTASSVFVTQSDESDQSNETWIKNIVIQEGIFMEVRKSMRMEFLEHLEEWKLKAIDLSKNVVKTKKEEISSELDLRLHLHEPRAGRVEMDIHNVRAGELVVHRDRVQRHGRGIVNTLTEQKAKFAVLLESWKTMSTQFCDAMQEKMEAVQAAEKMNKLLSIQKQARESQTNYLSDLRSAMKSHQLHLEESLHELQQSNSKFSESLKTFADGGNFCLEEVSEYGKTLSKLSGRIESVESALQHDLSSWEKRLVDTANTAMKQWEEKFRHHLLDLTFVEKVSRLLTNVQVKIKGEVAASNSQTQMLIDAVVELEKRCDAVESPNLDKEQLTAEQLLDSLPEIFKLYKERVAYLDCCAIKHALMTQSRLETATYVEGVPHVATFTRSKATHIRESASGQATHRKGSAAGRGSALGQKSGSRAGSISKQGSTLPVSNHTELQQLSSDHGPISAINLTRSILKHTQAKEHKRFSIDDVASQSMTSMPCPLPAMDASAKIMSVSLAGNLDKHLLNKPTTSALGRRKAGSKKAEKKYASFGDDDDDSENFLSKIRKILINGRDSLFLSCDLFYKQKGSRVLTRPALIHDSLEQCTEALNARLQSYRAQAESYRNSCIQELTDQLSRLSSALLRVPTVLFRDLLREELEKLDYTLTDANRQHDQHVDRLNKKKTVHESELRVVLGHPRNSEKLTRLSTDEVSRIDEVERAINEHSGVLQTSLVTLAQDFLSRICDLSERSLHIFDNMTTTQDVITVVTEPKKKTMKELLKEGINQRETVFLPAASTASRATLSGTTWPGLPVGELTVETAGGTKKLLPSVKTTKATDVHQIVITSRDQAYQEYLVNFRAQLLRIEDNRQKQLDTSKRWREKWLQSVVRIRQLY
ncbi:coiled-coil domain-containing protein 180-like isoform X2 [Corticium candelabrum]|uniref:coiled-coil domain-containing protein 180-like isoform X2 n=1 Tax=Corticium candelabrum TaxID=121492 RepID=UPI002E25E695|nr:coiled-coil domain-containing protein 180-like isoform X2 [Corticium candelabrum]